MKVEQWEQATPLAEALTAREQEVLNLVGQGRTNRQIAGELVLAHSTVRWYLRQIYAKLGVEARGEAVARAQALGLTGAPTAAGDENLPAAATPFVGRQVELQGLDEWLLDPQMRLISIVGPGGMGKTRLALALAARQTGRQKPGSDRLLFPDGVWHVSLAPIESAAQVAPAVAEALGLALQPPGERQRSPEKQVSDFLRGKRLLLVMDNFEHLPDAAPLLARLMGEASQVKVLVTSRQRLQLQGEHLFWIQGLEVPAEDAGPAAARSTAVRLFANTARRVEAAFALDEEEVAVVARICRLLEGMPLAIELAASWAGVLRPAAIEQEVRRGLEILAGELRDVPRRHRSMRAALSASWERLEAGEREVLGRLAIFKGRFTREAAREVARAELPALVGLVERSWLVYDQRPDSYQMHGLLRQYAVESVSVDAAAEHDTREGHSRFFCAQLASFEEKSRGSDLRPALEQMNEEIHDALVAWRWAITEKKRGRLEQAFGGLAAYCAIGGHDEIAQAAFGPLVDALVEATTRDERRLHLRALAVLASPTLDVDGEQPALAWVEKALAEVDPDRTWAYRPAVMRVLAEGRRRVDRGAAVDLLEDALALAETGGNRHEQMAILSEIAPVLHYGGAVEEALRRARDGLEMARASGSLLHSLNLLRVTCILDWYQLRLDDARQAGEEGLALARRLASPSYEAAFHEPLAWVEWLSGRFEAACDYDRQALRFYERVGQEGKSAQMHAHLALALLHLARYDEATGHARSARDLARSCEEIGREAFAVGSLGEIALARGEYETAVARFDEALAFLRAVAKSWQPDEVAYYLCRLAAAHLALERVDEARPALEEALAIILETRSFKVGMALTTGALLAVHEGRTEEALVRWMAARRLVHVRASAWFAAVAGERLDAAAHGLSAAEVERAMRRGQATNLWDVAAAVHEGLVPRRTPGIDVPG